MENLKRHDWQINFSSIRPREKDLFQFDFFEQPFDRLLVQYF